LRHGRKIKKLGRKWAHRRALIRNLLCALFTHERIKTTISKAKEARRFADRLITFAKVNTLAARREVRKYLADESLVHKLFSEIAPRLKDRTSGYTRIFRLGPRPGDGAEMAIIELVAKKEATQKEKVGKEKKPKAKKPKGKVAQKEEPKKASKEKSKQTSAVEETKSK